MQQTVRNLFPVALILFTALLAWLTYSIFGDAALARISQSERVQKMVLLDRLQAQVERSYRYGNMSWLEESLTGVAVEPHVVAISVLDERGVLIAGLDRAQVGQPVGDIIEPLSDSHRGLQGELVSLIGSGKPSQLLVSQRGEFIGAVYPISLALTETGFAQKGYLWFEKDLRPQQRAALKQIGLQTLALMLGVGFLAVCLGLLFHVVVTRRIGKLITAMSKVSAGDLDARVSITSNDEFGELGRYFNDMLDRREATERALTQSEKLKSIGTLSSGIAHDFNNVLQAIAGYSRIARSRVESNDLGDVIEYLDHIEAARRRATSLVERILSFSRAPDADFRPVLVQQVLKDTMPLLRSTFPSTIRIQSDVDESCPSVRSDATQLSQLLTNLCTNALHAMEDRGGTLSINVKQSTLAESNTTLTGRIPAGDYVELSVGDTGTGIDSAILDRLIDPFFTTKDVGKGTGLGLSIVHGVVSTAQGGLIIDTEPGAGTTVRVLLPRAVDDKGAVLQKSTNDVAPVVDDTCHVMLVDDEIAITKTTAALLEREGCDVLAFNSPEEALVSVADADVRTDVAVLDYTMPGMTGLDLAHRLEQTRPELPIILATGMLDHGEFERRRSGNIVAIVRKPYETSMLLTTIRKAVANAAMLQDAVEE